MKKIQAGVLYFRSKPSRSLSLLPEKRRGISAAKDFNENLAYRK